MEMQPTGTDELLAAELLCGVGLSAHSKNLICFLPSSSAAQEDVWVYCVLVPPYHLIRKRGDYLQTRARAPSGWRRSPYLALEVPSRGRVAETRYICSSAFGKWSDGHNEMGGKPNKNPNPYSLQDFYLQYFFLLSVRLSHTAAWSFKKAIVQHGGLICLLLCCVQFWRRIKARADGIWEP